LRQGFEGRECAQRPGSESERGGIPVSPPSPAEAGYGGHSPPVDREGGIRSAVALAKASFAKAKPCY
jgi:hypothetical protein